MAFIPIPNVAKITLQWLWNGQVIDLTLSVKKASTWTTGELGDIGNIATDWWNDNLKDWSTQQIGMTGVNVTDQSSDSAPSVDLAVNPTIFGTNTSGSAPNNVALVTSLLTDLRGRSYRGRAYTGGIPTNMVLNSTTANSALAVAHNDAYADFGNRIDVAGYEWVVGSRYTGGAPRVTGVSTPITAVRTEIFFDSQRRRLAGRGI